MKSQARTVAIFISTKENEGFSWRNVSGDKPDVFDNIFRAFFDTISGRFFLLVDIFS